MTTQADLAIYAIRAADRAGDALYRASLQLDPATLADLDSGTREIALRQRLLNIDAAHADLRVALERLTELASAARPVTHLDDADMALQMGPTR